MNPGDEFGLRRAHVHWVLNDADSRNVPALGFELVTELVAPNVARVQLGGLITDTDKVGTTRTAGDPRFGVVDATCQVHGVGDLFVAGSNVFPTCGGATPR